TLAAQHDFAAGRCAHAGDRLRELALAVAGDAGDREDLAGPQRQIDPAQRIAATIALRPEGADFEHRLADLVAALDARSERHLAPDHQRRERARRRVAGG